MAQTLKDSLDDTLNGKYVFINNCFGSFFRGVLDWFSDDLYPRFNYKVIGTYDKAVEFFNKKKDTGGEINTNLLPSITLDPSYDFSPEERGGRFLWQTYYLHPKFGRRLFNAVDLYEQELLLTPIYSRYEGTFEVIFWMSSAYELMDFRTLLLQTCGGFGRYIRPKYFSSFIALPDEIKDYIKPDGQPIDWNNSGGTVMMINNINKEKYVLPIALNPIWKLESFNDNSQKYGGDQIAEYKLSASFKYEIELPTYMILSKNQGNVLVKLDYAMSKVYTNYNWQSPYTLLYEIGNIKSDSRFSKDLKNFRNFELSDSINLAAISFQNAINYPPSYKIIDWNPIISGNIINVNNPEIKITKDDIIYIDEFKVEYLSHIRIANGVLSRRGGQLSTLFKKCKELNKRLIIHPDMYTMISPYFSNYMTIDFSKSKIYEGILEVREIDPSEPHYGYDVINYLKRKEIDLYNQAVENTKDGSPFGEYKFKNEDNQQVLIGQGDGNLIDFDIGQIPSPGFRIFIDDDFTSQYELIGTIIKFSIPPPTNSMIFLMGGTVLTKETKLVALYEYDITDEENGSADLDFPLEVRSGNLIVNSYIGVLKEGTHWELDTENKLLKVKIKPKAGELVEIFQLKDT